MYYDALYFVHGFKWLDTTETVEGEIKRERRTAFDNTRNAPGREESPRIPRERYLQQLRP